MMNKIHNAGPNSHRMPLILSKELALKWLESNLSDAEMNKVIHYEFPENEMEAWPVNTIRTRKENNRNIIERLDESLYPAL
jgi:putative SOS response-associated peptidase YedK